MKRGSIETRLDRLEAVHNGALPDKPWLVLKTHDGGQTYTTFDGQAYSADDLPGLEAVRRLCIVEYTAGPISPLGADG